MKSRQKIITVMKNKTFSSKLNFGIIMLFALLCFTELEAQPKTDTTFQQTYYKFKILHLPHEKRPEVRYELQQLPFKNTGGELPTFDGEHFQVNLFQQQVSSPDEAARMITQMLQALKSPLQVNKELKLKINITTAKSDEGFVEQKIKEGTENTKKKLSGEIKNLGKSTDEYLEELAAELRKQSKVTITIFSFAQFLDSVLIDNTAINIASRNGLQISSIYGKFYNSVTPKNKVSMALTMVVAKAVSEIKASNTLKNIDVRGTNEGQVVLIPYEDGFKYVWKTIITADGPYTVWIDAETGKILQLLPNFFFSDNAKGLVFNPDPNAGTTVMTFEVDGPSGGKYKLKKTGYMTMANSGADGTTGVVEITDDMSGTANFDQSPINGTVVEKVSQTNYNGLFQQVNVYGHTFNERRYYEIIGSEPFGTVNITVNQGGEDNAHPNSFFTCSGTLTGATGCGNIYNTAIDATVVAHEFGHVLNGMQYGVGGGSMSGSINEGMADFWACTTFNLTMVAAWTAHNCAGPTQGGWLPRQMESLDVYPEHKNLTDASNEGHSSGQMIAWAMWSARFGMLDAMGFGKLSIDLNTIKGMTSAGVGVLNDGTDKAVHDYMLDLLKQIAPLYSSSRLIHKLLAGYARAGIFLTPKDAIIDIDHSYLNRTSAAGPTFTVWTGRDYTFSGSTVSTASPPFNTQFMIEVANNETFTTNLVSSGWLGGVTSGAGGTATWTLPAGDWATLKPADFLFYRVTTKDGGGADLRHSWHPGNGCAVNVPVGKSAINGTGTKDCSCSASAAPISSAMALIPAIPLFLFILLRRKLKNR